jgi:hypothetical protein
MNFDPIAYSIHRVDRVEERLTDVQRLALHNEEELDDHASRLDALERWRASLTAIWSRWPLIAIPGGLGLLNVAPAETVKAIVGILKAML